jgi:hypothetical protein
VSPLVTPRSHERPQLWSTPVAFSDALVLVSIGIPTPAFAQYSCGLQEVTFFLVGSP